MITLHTCTIIFYLEYFILRLILPLISYLVFLLQLFYHVLSCSFGGQKNEKPVPLMNVPSY